MTNFILLIIAILLDWVLTPLGFLWTHIRFIYGGIRRKSLKYTTDNLNRYYYECAFAKDVCANPKLQWLLNDLAVKPNSPYRFGELEALSKTFGKVKSVNMDYPFGRFLAYQINAIAALMKDFNHVEKAANRPQ